MSTQTTETLMPRKLLLIAILALVTLAGASGPAGAASVATFPDFNEVKSVFDANGFSPYKSTYVHCYTSAQWSKVMHGVKSVMGYYRTGPWINTRLATCTNAGKLLDHGQFNYTNVTALTTLLHETVHRQGVRDEATAECLGDWLTGHAVWGFTGSLAKGKKALGYARVFAQRRLLVKYRTSKAKCAQIAVDHGVQALNDAPGSGSPPPETPLITPQRLTPPATTTPSPPTTPTQLTTPTQSTAPVQPAAATPTHSEVVFDQTYTMSDDIFASPPVVVPPVVQVNGAHRIEVTYSLGTAVDPDEVWWQDVQGVVQDMVPGPNTRRSIAFGVLHPGGTVTEVASDLSGTAAVVLPAPTVHIENRVQPYPLQLIVRGPGTLTIRVVGYS
jgi:hypothetical protein